MNRKKIKYDGKIFYRQRDGYYRDFRTTLHRYKFEKKYGSILPGFAIHHIDGDKRNNNINNLMLVSIKEHILIHKKMKLEIKYKNQLQLFVYRNINSI